MSCPAATVAEAPPPGPVDPDLARLCARAGLEVAGRLGLSLPDSGVSRTFTLPRARAEGSLQAGEEVGARLVLTAVRSGGDEGYLGVDGEALLPEIEIAEAWAGHAPWGLRVAAGLISDPWVASGDAAWGMRALAPGFGEATGWMDKSDLGAFVGWTAHERMLSARVDLTSGEGGRIRERNEGKDLAGTLSLRPLAGDREALVLTAYGRDGSRGLGLARDHRLGLRLSGSTHRLDWGAEGLAAWGVGGDELRAPLGGSAWANVRPWGPLLATLRLDLSTESLGATHAGREGLLAAVGAEVHHAESATLRALAGYSGARAGAQVSEIAGATVLERVDTVFVQLEVALSEHSR